MPIATQRPDVAQEYTKPWPVLGLERRETCPVCGSGRRDLLYEGLTDRVFRCAPGEWTLYLCRNCRGAYLDPRPTPDSIALAYQNYFTHETAPEPEAPRSYPLGYLRTVIKSDYLKARFGATPYPRMPFGRLLIYLMPYRRLRWDRWFRHLPLPSKSANLLDVGCGSGDFVRVASSLGWDAQGMDPDPKAVAVARKTGLSVVQGGFPRTGMPDGQFDAVTLSHVIEHVHDPIMALREVHRILKPGGRIWIAAPNLESVGHQLFNCYWIGLDPPRHLMNFNASSLKLACERAGFINPFLKRSHPDAVWFFLASLRILQNQDPYRLKGEELPLALKWRAKWTDMKAILRPEQGEELVMIATKP